MGLPVPVTDFILQEHRYRPITGDVLFVGRQTVFLGEQALRRTLDKFGIVMPAGPIEYDTETVGVGVEGLRCVTDRYFMQCLGVPKVRFLDVSNYEGADIVHDLGQPVPQALHERFDFIYNGGCFDNMFNPGVAMMNLSKMLKPGGRIVCMESGSSYNSPYVMYSPGWFFDYYAVNHFADCKVYICSYRSNEELFYGPWGLFLFDWDKHKNGGSPEAIYGNHIILLTIAEKGAGSTSERQPIQFQYRQHDQALNAEMEGVIARFGKSPRPVVGRESWFPESRYLRIATDLLRLSLYRKKRYAYLRPLGRLG